MSQAALLARRLQQNWMDRHPHDTGASGVNLDDSLTSLGWLQNLRVAEFAQSRETNKPGVKLDGNRSFIKQEPNTSPTAQSYLQCPDLDHGLETGPRVPSLGSPYNTSDHRSNEFVKPPYSYARLICMAMKATGSNKITLSSIYSWITDNFDYYRLSEPSWQNSIRHNLSLNKCFEKVPRRKDEPGKGGFWRIKPEYTELMESSIFTKRRNSGDATASHPFKRLKLEDDNTRGLSDMRRAREDKLLSNCASDIDANEDSENSLTLRGDLNWPSLLNQDIDVGGQTIKTEAILDECENSFGSFSPRCTENNSDFLGIDFLTQTNYNITLPLEVQTNFPLDLTVQGTTIRPPEWWTSDDNNNMINITSNYINNTDSGLNTPAPPTPEPENGEIFWGESLKLGSSGSSFDLESLFAFDKMSTPKEMN